MSFLCSAESQPAGIPPFEEEVRLVVGDWRGSLGMAALGFLGAWKHLTGGYDCQELQVSKRAGGAVVSAAEHPKQEPQLNLKTLRKPSGHWVAAPCPSCTEPCSPRSRTAKTKTPIAKAKVLASEWSMPVLQTWDVPPYTL